MPQITVTLVDHTDSPDLRPDIMRNLEDIFGDLVFSNSEPGVVNMRWTTVSPPAGEQDLVLHFVQNIASSYVASEWPGKPIKAWNGGFTRLHGKNMAGSEFYKVSVDQKGKPRKLTAKDWATLAAHEAMHNALNMDNAVHSQGGIAGEPAQLPVNDENRSTFQAALGNIPVQLL
jgi:hypothetical protein